MDTVSRSREDQKNEELASETSVAEMKSGMVYGETLFQPNDKKRRKNESEETKILGWKDGK